MNMVEIPPVHSPKFQGGFSMQKLVTNQVNECQKCKNKQSELHQVIKTEFVLHVHHLHSM